MATLEEVLNRINENKEQDKEQKVHKVKIHGIEYDVLEMTNREKRDFIYSRSATKKSFTVGEIVEWLKPYIYKSFQLAEFADKLVKENKIKTFYDIVEELFTADEILEIMQLIMEINHISASENIEEDYEEIKKQ